jgi:flagellar biosynthesis protein FlhG
VSHSDTPEPRRGSAVVFSVTSGKGGVGKTSVSVNMAVEFAKSDHRTIVVDCDLGLANAHILAGLRTGKTMSDYLDGRADLMEIIIDGPAGVKFISGGSGIKEMANLDEAGRQRIIDVIADLRPFCDVIILDTGAGISRAVTDFVAVSDHTIVVTTADFAAVADAYGIIKTCVHGEHANSIHVLVNRVRSPHEAEQVFNKLRDCAKRFLGLDLNWLGLLPEDSVVEAAVVQRSPFREAFPESVVSRYLKTVVASLERLMPTAAT